MFALPWPPTIPPAPQRRAFAVLEPPRSWASPGGTVDRLGELWSEDGRSSPWKAVSRLHTMIRVRILVLWTACAAISREEDARWVREECGKLTRAEGVRDVALHPVESAAAGYACGWDWGLELVVDEAPNAIVRRPPCAEFLADLRLLGTKPSVLVLPGEVAA